MSEDEHSITEAEAAYIIDRGLKLEAWQEQQLHMQKNEVSRLAKLKEAIQSNRIHKLKHGPNGPEAWGLTGLQTNVMGASSFVLTHDWRAAFGDSIGEVKPIELKQPLPVCAFEMRVSGVSLVAAVEEVAPGERRMIVLADIGAGMWTEVEYESRAFAFVSDQAYAALIALDSQVASCDLIQPPAVLNAKRIKSGKAALPDYRVVRLARRSNASHADSGNPTGRHPRLHFRRGHWRHYEDRKTWINWTLVGNPDLGFIDKHYKL